MYEIKLKRTIVDAKNKEKEVTEVFLSEFATSCAEAEELVKEYWADNCEVVGVILSKVKEILNTPTQEEKMDLFVFKAILEAMFTNDDGEQKPMKYQVLVWAKNAEHAMDITKEYIRQNYDMSLIAISKTKIVEVI